jgi:2Fe-2S ferredoxin
VFVDQDWMSKLAPQDDMEKSMLEFAEGVVDNSRLACQIKLSDALDGLVVRLPESQH